MLWEIGWNETIFQNCFQVSIVLESVLGFQAGLRWSSVCGEWTLSHLWGQWASKRNEHFPRNHRPLWRPQRSKTEALIQFLLKIKGIGIRCFWPPVWLKTNVHVGSRVFFCITSNSSGISWVHGIGSIRTSSSASSGGTLRLKVEAVVPKQNLQLSLNWLQNPSRNTLWTSPPK